MEKEKSKGGRPKGSIDARRQLQARARELERAIVKAFDDQDAELIAEKVVRNARKGEIDAVRFIMELQRSGETEPKSGPGSWRELKKQRKDSTQG